MSPDRPPLHQVKSFGAIDADADLLLTKSFQDHEAYDAILTMQHFLVLGRKGAGKTAIYKQIVNSKSSAERVTLATGHSFDDYPWHHHNLQSEQGVPEERRFVHSWKYLILMGLARLALSDPNAKKTPAGEVLEKFLVDSYGRSDPEFYELFSPHKELHFKGALKLPGAEAGVENVPVKDLPRHINDANRLLQRAVFACLNPDKNYFVCFDQLDLGFNPKDRDYAQRLIGLLVASREIFLAARDSDVWFNPVVFLRDDIYHELHFEDKNKISENFTSFIRWQEDPPGLTLKGLMERRFAVALAADTPSIPWEEVFDEGKEMPGRQSKYKHICDRTFLRPRDMIKFCNEVLAAYKNTNSLSGRFDNDLLRAARSNYSEYLLNELDDEVSKHIENYRDTLEILKSVGMERFSLDDFLADWEGREELAGQAPQAILEKFFEFSIIAYLKPGGQGGGSEWIWQYRDPRARFNKNADKFRVHPGLKESLDLIR